MPEVLPKIAALRARIKSQEYRCDIMVDGGINLETACACAQHGANQFVTGSFLFKQQDMTTAIRTMRTACAAAHQ